MRTFSVTVTGREAHSSQRGQGVSAIGEAIKLMALVTEMDREAAQDILEPGPFEPAGVTMTVGTVTGGTANNILARHCTFCWDLRAPQNDQADRYESRFRAEAVALDAAIKALAPEGGVKVTRLSNAPPLEQADGSPAEVFARALTGDNGLAGVAFVAEAGLYQRAGIPAVLCGPGSIRQAHQPDEWIALEQMQAGADFIGRLLERMGE
jgi:acetylornithine deacetylase